LTVELGDLRYWDQTAAEIGDLDSEVGLLLAQLSKRPDGGVAFPELSQWIAPDGIGSWTESGGRRSLLHHPIRRSHFLFSFVYFQ